MSLCMSVRVMQAMQSLYTGSETHALCSLSLSLPPWLQEGKSEVVVVRRENRMTEQQEKDGSHGLRNDVVRAAALNQPTPPPLSLPLSLISRPEAREPLHSHSLSPVSSVQESLAARSRGATRGERKETARVRERERETGDRTACDEWYFSRC